MSRYLVACDAGGTMTDVIVVDEEGRSVIGKAPTSPQDESIGYMESFWEALEYMGISQEEGSDFGKEVETAIYTGTSMLNTVINMSGYKTGILATKGFEDIISQGRGKQTFIGAQWSEITHMQYRRHRIPLVPSQLSPNNSIAFLKASSALASTAARSCSTSGARSSCAFWFGPCLQQPSGISRFSALSSRSTLAPPPAARQELGWPPWGGLR